MAALKTYQKEFWSCNTLLVEAGTNTPQGGDAGHGGRTILKLRNIGGTTWQLNYKLEDTPEDTIIYGPDEITIKLEGDTEADTFIDALEYAVSIYKAQRLMSNTSPKRSSATAQQLNSEL